MQVGELEEDLRRKRAAATRLQAAVAAGAADAAVARNGALASAAAAHAGAVRAGVATGVRVAGGAQAHDHLPDADQVRAARPCMLAADVLAQAHGLAHHTHVEVTRSDRFTTLAMQRYGCCGS